MVDFSFIVSLYVSDLPNVTISSRINEQRAGIVATIFASGTDRVEHHREGVAAADTRRNFSPRKV